MEDNLFKAGMNLEAARDLNPDKEAQVFNYATQNNLPRALVRQMDNFNIAVDAPLTEQHPFVRSFMAADIGNAAMAHGRMDALSKVAANIEGAPDAKPRPLRFPKRSPEELKKLGVMTPDELNALPPTAYEKELQRVEGAMRDYKAKTEERRAYLRNRIAAATVLTFAREDYGDDLVNDENAYALCKAAAATRGYDMSGVTPDMVSPADVTDVDYWEFANVFGARNIRRYYDMKNAFDLKPGSLTDFEIPDLEHMDYEQLAAVAPSILQMYADARNTSVGHDIMKTLSVSTPYMAEFAGAGAIGTAAKAAVGSGVKGAIGAATKNLAVNAAKVTAADVAGKVVAQSALDQTNYDITVNPTLDGKVLTWDEANALSQAEKQKVVLAPAMTTEFQDDYADAFVRNFTRLTLANASEGLGGYLPKNIGLIKFLPKKARRMFLRAALTTRKATGGTFHGFFGELGEEYANTFMDYTATQVAEATGYEGLNLGQKSAIVPLYEQGLTAATVFITQAAVGGPSAVRHGIMRSAMRAQSRRSYVNWLTDVNARVSEIPGSKSGGDTTHVQEKGASATAQALQSFILDSGAPVNSVISLKDAVALYQAKPETAARVGITPAVLNGSTAAEYGITEVVIPNARLLADLSPAELKTVIPFLKQSSADLTPEEAERIDEAVNERNHGTSEEVEPEPVPAAPTAETEGETDEDSAAPEERAPSLHTQVKRAMREVLKPLLKTDKISLMNYNGLVSVATQQMLYLDENTELSALDDLIANLKVRVPENESELPVKAEKGTVRGLYHGTDLHSVIYAMKHGADATTGVHEFTHYMFDTMKYILDNKLDMKDVEGNSRIAEDYAAIQGFLAEQKYKSAEGTLERRIEEHEYVARAFEAYIMRGAKAPSSKLATAFRALKNAFVRIYKTLRALNVKLTPEITHAFDSMLRTDAQIEVGDAVTQAIDMFLTPETAGLLGLNANSIKAFKKIFESAKEKKRLEIERRKEAIRLENMPRWREEATKEFEADPELMYADSLLAIGGIDTDGIKHYFPAVSSKTLTALRHKGYVRKDGAPFRTSVLENNPTFDEVDLLKLTQLPTRSEYISNRVKEFEVEELASLAEEDPLLLDLEATEQFLDSVISELNGKEPNAKRVNNEKKIQRAEARLELETENVSKILHSVKPRNETLKLANKVALGIANKNAAEVALAFTELRQKIVVLSEQNIMAAEIRKAIEGLKDFREIKKGKIDEDYHNQILLLLGNHGLTSKAPKNVALNVFNSDDPNAPTNGILFSEGIDAKSLANGEKLGAMSYRTFINFSNALNFLYEEGKGKLGEEKASYAAKIRSVYEAVNARLNRFYETDENGEILREANGDPIMKKISVGKKFLKYADPTLYGSMMLYRTIEHLDGGKKGPFHDLIYFPLEAAASKCSAMNEKIEPIIEAIASACDCVDKSRLAELPAFPFEMRNAGYKTWNVQNVVMFALYMGSASSRQRLFEGFKWTKEEGEENARQILSLFNHAGVDYINGISQLVSEGEFTDEFNKTFKAVNHYTQRRVLPLPFAFDAHDLDENGESEVYLNGGYIPLSYLPGTRETEKVDKSDFMPVYQTPNAAHVRLETLYNPPPVDLSFHALSEHLHQVSHYVSYREPIQAIKRVFATEDLYNRMLGVLGKLETRQFSKMLNGIANPSVYELKTSIGRGLGYVQSALAVSALGLNTDVTAKQFGSLLNNSDEIGGNANILKWLARNVMHYNKVKDFVWKRSAPMRARAKGADPDIKHVVEAAVGSKVNQFTERAKFFAFVGIRLADNIVARAGWMAAYEYHLNRDAVDAENPTTEEQEKAAIQADSFVARSQGSTSLLNKTARDTNVVLKSITPFFTAVNAAANAMASGVGTFGSKTWEERISSLLGTYLYQAAAMWLIMGTTRGMWSGNDKKRKRALDMATMEAISVFTQGSLPGLVIDAFIRGGNNSGISHAPGIAAYEYLWKSGSAIIKSMTGKNASPEAFAYETTKAITPFFGLPLVQFYERTRRHLNAFSKKDIPAKPRAITGKKTKKGSSRL